MTTVATAHQTMADIVQIAQTNLDLWNNLLQASGGILNPSKCLWFQFNWDFHPNGTVRLHQPPHQQITVTNPPSNPQPIKRLTPNKAHRYLGVYLTTDGNYKQELTVFRQQNARFINLLRMHPFSHQEIHTIYLQCYLPSVAYPLPASTLPSKPIHNAQKTAMSAFLTKLGYLRTFPRAITYALINCGGLGFRQLGHEAGIQQSMQFLKHLCLNTSIQQIIQIHIQHYQLVSGFERSILEDTQTIPWSNAPWMDRLQQFLRHINGKIILKNPWVSVARQKNDRHIMSDILEYQLKNNLSQ